MEIIGKVRKMCLPIDGETAAGPWVKRDMVVTTAGDDARDVCVTFFGERKVEKLKAFKEGDMVQVFATVKSRAATDDSEKWFTSVDGSSVKLLSKAEPEPPAPTE